MGVLVLNASYEPLHVVSIPHAVRMLVRQVAVVEEAHEGRTIGSYPVPRVLRLLRYVTTAWRYAKQASYSRANVLRRDRHQCAYCPAPATTIDHVLPRSRGGGSTWLNTVASCRSCNERKGARTPVEARMRLRFDPFVPTLAQLSPAP